MQTTETLENLVWSVDNILEKREECSDPRRDSHDGDSGIGSSPTCVNNFSQLLGLDGGDSIAPRDCSLSSSNVPPPDPEMLSIVQTDL